MTLRFPAAILAAASVLAGATLLTPSAHASVLSLLPGGCGNQVESQPFTPWNDSANYTPVLGGSFETGGFGWQLTGGAHVTPGSESFGVSGPGSSSLALPAGSAGVSPYSCTDIYHPTVRLFVRNTGAPTSHLTVQALYPGLLGGLQSATVGEVSASSSWSPSPVMSLLTS